MIGFDLDLLHEYGAELGVAIERRSPELAIAQVGPFRLCFENLPERDDADIFFEGSNGGWHSHGELWGSEVALAPVEIVEQLVAGKLLVSRTEFPGGIVDIALHHAELPVDPRQIGPGEAVTLYRLSGSRQS